jgi:hypothetical protein
MQPFREALFLGSGARENARHTTVNPTIDLVPVIGSRIRTAGEEL